MTDNYGTPDWLMKVFEDWYDPCPLEDSPIHDGLRTDWKDKTYVNPPYSDPLPWVEKAIEESKKGKTIVMLLKADTSTKLFAKLNECGARIFWMNRRMKFKDQKYTATFPVMLVMLNPKEEEHEQ